MKQKHPSECAFTRLELLASLAAVFLIACVTLPALGGAWNRSEQGTCLNNLRQIGRAYAEWGTGHDGQVPWCVSGPQGGTWPNEGLTSSLPTPRSYAGNPWFQFSWISNELGSPKILVCPADPKRRPAQDFSASPEGGLLHVSRRNNAISYSVGVDVQVISPTFLLAADRDLRVDSLGHCSLGFSLVASAIWDTVSYQLSPNVAWTNELHAASGNCLYLDGHAEQVPQDKLALRFRFGDDNGSIHFLIP